MQLLLLLLIFSHKNLFLLPIILITIKSQDKNARRNLKIRRRNFPSPLNMIYFLNNYKKQKQLLKKQSNIKIDIEKFNFK